MLLDFDTLMIKIFISTLINNMLTMDIYSRGNISKYPLAHKPYVNGVNLIGQNLS